MKNNKTNKKISANKIGMPLIKDYPSRAEWETVCWLKIIKSEKLLNLIITSHERRNLIARAATADRIISGKSYREIAEELWLSPQTISGVRKAINERVYRSYLERSRKGRKKKVYSSDPTISKRKHHGRPHRTKYGTIYLPL